MVAIGQPHDTYGALLRSLNPPDLEVGGPLLFRIESVESVVESAIYVNGRSWTYLRTSEHYWARCSATAVAEKSLQTPHGGKLVDLMLPDSQKAAEIASCTKELELSDRNACDTELLIVGCDLYPLPIVLCAHPADLPVLGRRILCHSCPCT